MIKQDRPMSNLIEIVVNMISNGSILESVESSIQTLR